MRLFTPKNNKQWKKEYLHKIHQHSAYLVYSNNVILFFNVVKFIILENILRHTRYYYLKEMNNGKVAIIKWIILLYDLHSFSLGLGPYTKNHRNKNQL